MNCLTDDEKAFVEELEVRMHHLQIAIYAQYPHKEYNEGQLSGYGYALAMYRQMRIAATESVSNAERKQTGDSR